MVALLDALEGEGGDEGGADAGAVLGGQDLDGVVALAQRLAVAAGLPVEDLLEGLGAAGLEVGVLEDGLVGLDWECWGERWGRTLLNTEPSAPTWAVE